MGLVCRLNIGHETVQKQKELMAYPSWWLKVCAKRQHNNWSVQICQHVYTFGEWPVDFVQSVFHYQRQLPQECSDHRTSYSLIVHASKIMLKVFTQRIEAKVESINFIEEDQCGFRKGKGTRDAIGLFGFLGERSLQHSKDQFVCFVDYMRKHLIELTGASFWKHWNRLV